VSRSHDETRVRRRLAASAISASSSGAVLRWFWATKSCRIRRRTDLDPVSHSCSSEVSRDTATSRFDDVMVSLRDTYRRNTETRRRVHLCENIIIIIEGTSLGAHIRVAIWVNAWRIRHSYIIGSCLQQQTWMVMKHACDVDRWNSFENYSPQRSRPMQ